MGRLAISLLLLLPLGAAAAAQGLGDAAARERQKRKAPATAEPKRVYGDHDLEKGRPPAKGGGDATSEGAASAVPAPVPQPDDEAAGDVASEERREQIERAAERLRVTQAEVSRLESRVKELQDRLNPMSLTYVYGQATSGDAAGEEMRIKDELARLPSDIELARRAVEDARKALDDARSRRGPLG